MLHIIGIIISLFLSTLLFTKKGKSKADGILAIWLFLIAIHLISYYLRISGDFFKFPYFLGLEIPMPLFHGPFLYLYTVSLTDTRIRKLHWFFHFIPVILGYMILSHFFLLSSAEKIQVYQNQGIGYTTLTTIIRFAILLSGLSYVGMCLLLLHRHRKNIPERFSALEKIDLNWLTYLIIGLGIIWLSVLFGNDISTFTLVDIFILFIGYFGVKQVGIFTNKVLPQTAEVVEAQDDPDKIKYQKSSLGEAALLEIHGRLQQLMKEEKLFKDPEIKLTELAQRLNVHAHALSQVINTMEHRNFYDYINDQRVDEFKAIVILPENQRYTLLFLAFEVGFNSKSSFNRNFKKSTGLAPTLYLKQQKIHLQDL
ncbi:helix-turn-helix domain-containing protein [Pedobacter sp. FW305-3-2-15-E-R2A2]|uniref:AraC family transcriptional regulator n=1 Tax=Pedobacter sp. FW305-3-2-15-E-R2A2 TaxID=3140251 RepID=UPI0031401569